MADWIILDKTTGIGSDEVTITVSSYTELTERLKNLVFTTTDNKASDTCIVKQYGEEGYLKVNPSSINMVYGGGYVDVTVSSTEDWTIGTLPAWISSNTSRGSKGDTIIRLTISSNSSTSERSYSISFVSENYNATLSVSQAKYVEGEIVPPTINPDDCEGGTFTVTIKGDGYWSFKDFPNPICGDALVWGTYTGKLTDDSIPYIYMNRNGYKPTVEGIDWALCNYPKVAIESLREAFGNGIDYRSYRTIILSKLDTSNVTDMRYMFADCVSLTSLDVTNFKTSNVTDMRGMFINCFNLTSLDVSKFDTRKVTNMENMFHGCKKLTSLDLSKFNTSNVTNMYSMFAYCTNLRTLDLSNFDTSKAYSKGKAYSMFTMDNNLTTVKVTNCSSSTQEEILKIISADLWGYKWTLSNGIIRRTN